MPIVVDEPVVYFDASVGDDAHGWLKDINEPATRAGQQLWTNDSRTFVFPTTSTYSDELALIRRDIAQNVFSISNGNNVFEKILQDFWCMFQHPEFAKAAVVFANKRRCSSGLWLAKNFYCLILKVNSLPQLSDDPDNRSETVLYRVAAFTTMGVRVRNLSEFVAFLKAGWRAVENWGEERMQWRDEELDCVCLSPLIKLYMADYLSQ